MCKAIYLLINNILLHANAGCALIVKVLISLHIMFGRSWAVQALVFQCMCSAYDDIAHQHPRDTYTWYYSIALYSVKSMSRQLRHSVAGWKRKNSKDIFKKKNAVDYGRPLLRMGRLLTIVLRVSYFNLSSSTPDSIGNHLAWPRRRSLMSSKSQIGRASCRERVLVAV